MLHNTDAKPPLLAESQANTRSELQCQQVYGLRPQQPSILLPRLTTLP